MVKKSKKKSKYKPSKPANITLEDLEKRNESIKKFFPNLPKCCKEGCNNLVDVIGDEQDTSCAYHRLLHDYFLYEVDEGKSHPNQSSNTIEQYRKIVNDWEEKMGKEECDKIVLMMANDPLNWMC